jgi:transcriptional regulator with XRE-family HTH domain
MLTAAAKFGALVRSARKAGGLKTWQVAERVDIDAKHLGRIERGEKQPSFDLIIDLARVFNVQPSKFFEFELSDSDPMLLQKQIAAMLRGRSQSDLRLAHEVLKRLL